MSPDKQDQQSTTLMGISEFIQQQPPTIEYCYVFVY